MGSRGTIFERALKWMALVGVVFALGSGQALAQTVEGAWYNVTGTGVSVVTVKMSADVQASGAGDIFEDFRLGTTAGTAGGPTTTASDEFTVTFGTATITGTPTLTYTPSTAAADPVIEDSGGRDLGGFNEPVMSAVPQIPSAINPPPALVGLDFSFEVPEAMGGVGDITYVIAAFGATSAGTHTAGELPDGLEFDGDDRMITGQPTTAGRFRVTVTATDEASTEIPTTSSSTNHVVTGDFFIDVSEPPDLTVTVSAAPETIAEGGASTITAMASRMVAAADEPVTIALAVVGEATLSANSITIAAGAQSGSVTLTSMADADYEPDTVTVTATGSGITGSQNVQIAVTDMAPPEILSVVVSAAPTTIAEGGTSTITAMANRQVMASDGPVTVNLRVVGEAALSANSITIAAGTRSGSVTLTSTADADYEDDTVTVTVTGTGIASNHPNVMVTVTDPAPAAELTVTVSAAPMTIAEGGTSTITAMANRAVTADDGTVTVDLSVVGDATLSAESITIAAGAQSGTAMLTAREDDDYEDETVTVTASGTGITGNQEVEISVTDNDTRPVPDVVRGQLTEFKLVGDGVTEKTIGGVERYHVPEGSQAVDLSVTVQWTHAEIAAIGYNTKQRIEVAIRSGGSTLPNWVSWIDGEGDVHFPRAGSLGNLAGGVVTVTTPRESQVPAAQRGSERHVKSDTKTLNVLILHDDHEAENDAFYIEATGGDVDLNAPRGVNAVTPEVVIEDDEDQTVTVKRGTRTSSTVYEGDSGDDVPEFTVAASPARVDLPLEVRLDMVDLGGTTVSSGEISLSKSSMTLNDGSTGNSDKVTVHLPASDGNRVDDDYELKASVNVYSVASGGYETIPAASHPIKVLDRHKLPELKVTPATGTVEEGGKIELTLEINRNPSNTPVSDDEKLQYTQEEVTIMLTMGAGSTAGASDFSIMTNPVTFAKRERGSYTAEKTVEVMATADDVLDDMEMLVLDAMVAGSVAANGSEKDPHAGVSTLTIEEGTAKLVWANSQTDVEAAIYAAKNAGMGDDMTFTAGEMIDVMGALLFSSAEGVTVAYTAESSMSDVASVSVSGGSVMVTAMGAGMADITITAHGSMPSGVKIVDQTDPGMASIMFPVEVGLEALSIMLSGPDDPHVVEGGMGAMVTATANRAVTEAVTVNLMRDRSMSTAGDADYMADPITIASGAMSGSTMVMAVEDDMMETVDNMPEELVLYGMAEGMAGEVTGEVHLHLWDAAVPALPVIAQLLLAAFLAVGGYRRYRRR